MQLPGLKSFDIPQRGFLLRLKDTFRKPGAMIQVKSTVTDSGAVGGGLPRATILRPGFVLGQKAVDSLFYKADDVTNVGNICTSGSATSLVAIGAGAASKTFKFKVNGGIEVTVTMGGGDNTCDLVVAKLMASIPFAGNLVATNVNTNFLKIQTLRAGVSEFFEITDGTINGQGGVANDTFANNTKAGGSDGDYRVLGLGGGGHEDHLEMLDATATAADQGAPNLMAGEFRESQLLGSTPEAKAVLARRGSFFG